jgi:chromosome segregation ATPase
MHDMQGVLAIFFLFGTPFAVVAALTFRMYLKHQAEMLDRKLLAQSLLTGQTQSEISALRQELAQLRDTSTQYDVSLQHSLEELQHRVATIEARNRKGSTLAPEEQQAVGNVPR